jgi:hypothetical protein
MTPAKLKALDLVDSFTYWNTAEAEREGFKSALKCIDEIIDSISIKNYNDVDKYEFWKEVKQEIEKL